MHSFQPITAEEFEINIFHLIGSDWMLITAEQEGIINTSAATWGGLGVLWDKNVAFVFIQRGSFTRELVDASDTFSLSFFGGAYKRELKYIKAVSGRDENKIKNARLTTGHHNNTPFIDEAMTVLICRKMAAQPLIKNFFIDESIIPTWYKADPTNPHIMYIAEITDFLVR